MSADKFTPGPWFVGATEHFNANRVWTADMKPIVNLCSFGTGPADIDPTAQANARLIAAAPELLQALRTMVEQSPIDEVGTLEWGRKCLDAAANARAAIAKAAS